VEANRSSNPLTERAAAAVSRQLPRGVEAVHSCGSSFLGASRVSGSRG
jgi:hypothetical protein